MPKLPDWFGDLVNVLTLLGMVITAGGVLWRLSVRMLKRERGVLREQVLRRDIASSTITRRAARKRVSLWESVAQEVRHWWLYKVMLVDRSPAQHLGIVLGLMLCIVVLFFINYMTPSSPLRFPGLIGTLIEWAPTAAIGFLSLLLAVAVARLLFVLNYEGEMEDHNE